MHDRLKYCYKKEMGKKEIPARENKSRYSLMLAGDIIPAAACCQGATANLF